MSNHKTEIIWKQIIVCAALCAVTFFISPTLAQQSGAGKNLRFLPGGGSTGSLVGIPDSASLDIANAVTLEAWVKRSDAGIGPNRIFTKAPEVYTLRIGQCCDQNVQFILNGQGQGIITTEGEDVASMATQWIHLAATWDGNGDKLMKIYINGRESAYPFGRDTVNPPLVNGTTELWLSLWAETFNGNIDQARIWNVARTPNQIRAWMHKTEGLNLETGLVSAWQMNEGTGLTTADLLGLNNGTFFSCDRFSNPTCSNNSNAPQWQNSTAPFGDKGVFVDATNAPTAVGAPGATLTATITSVADLSNNLGLYQFGSPTGALVTAGETFPAGINARANIVWGAFERGTVTSNLVFDYSQVSSVTDPTRVRIIKRTDSDDSTWELVAETARNDQARTITINGVTDSGEYALGIAPPPCTPAPAGLVSWYQADGSALDARGGNHAATQPAMNGATYTTGKVGQAFNFDGTDDFVAALDNASLDITGDLTIDAWINPQTYSNFPHILSKRDVNNFNVTYELLLSGSGQLRFSSMTSGAFADVNSNGTIPLNIWTHVAVTIEGTTLKLYINGVLDKTESYAVTRAATNGRLTIGTAETSGCGGSGVCEFFKGQIDEAQIFNRALSASEIAAIFNADAAGKCKPTATVAPPNLLAWLAGDGNTSDLSGNGNNGTLMGNVNFAVGRVGQTFNFPGGTNDVVSLGSGVNPTGSLTVEAWIKPNVTSGFTGIVTKWGQQFTTCNAPNSDSFALYLDNGKLVGYINQFNNGNPSEPGLTGSGTIPANAYSHVAMTYNQTNGAFALYVNGAPVAAATVLTAGICGSGKRVFIGGEDSGQPRRFNGQIDEPTIYSRGLSSVEIQAIYNAGLAGKLKQSSANPAVVGEATVTFANVTTPGTTQVIPLDPATQPPLPVGQTHTGLIYDIATTAVYTGSVGICFNLPAFAGLSELEFSERRVLHLENGVWEDRTTSRDFALKRICASSALSPFAIVDSNIAPTAAAVSVSGRVVFTPESGVRKARVTATNASGERQTVFTDGRGNYRFEELAAGEIYIVEVFAKRHRFAPQVITPTGDVENLNFAGEP